MLEIGKPVNFATLRDLSCGGAKLAVSEAAYRDIDRGAAAVAAIVQRGQPAYGVNTGFGRLAQTHMPNDQLELLQRNLVLSHAVGVGEPLPAGVVRLTLALKIVTLAQGFSGVRRELVDAKSGDDELPRLAVDVAEARRRGDDTLEAIGDGCVVCHDRNVGLYSPSGQC